MNNGSFDGDDILLCAIHSLFEFFDQFSVEFEHQKRGFHMLPRDPEMFRLDGHILMQRDHVRSLVVIRPAEEMSEEEDHRRMQLRDVADVLEEEGVDTLVSQHVLVELSDYLFELVVAA